MQWLFIVLGLALAAAPIVYIVPRPSQRRQAALRQRAMGLGLDVRLNPLPQPRRLRVRKEQTRQGVRILHRCRRAGRDAADFWILIREEGEEELSPDAAANKSLIETMPQMVVALEHASDGVAAWCTESGSVEDIDIIAAELSRLATANRRQDAA